MRVQTGWMLGISLARRGCMLMGLSICATLGGTISYGYGSPPTTISSCRYRLAYHRDIRIRALYGGYDPIGSRYRSPYCLSAACPLDYDDPPLTRFFSCFGYVRSRCENEPLLIQTNFHCSLFASIFFGAKLAYCYF